MADPQSIAEATKALAATASDLATKLNVLAQQAGVDVHQTTVSGGSEFWYLLTVFVLACFVGFYAVWSVTPALHTPLMAVINALSSVIIVGTLIVAGSTQFGPSQILGIIAVVLASISLFGGFIVTHRILDTVKNKSKEGAGS